MENFDEYETVFIGYPIWWGDMPMIVYNFLEQHNFDGKTIIPFNTHEGSGQAGTQNTLENMFANTIVEKGLALRGADAQKMEADTQAKIDEWLEELGFPKTEIESSTFNFETKTVKLNSGYEMPILGLGTYALSDEQAENSTYWALKAGFRLIDTARIYGNESGVGRGIKRAIDEGIVTREEIFVTTKMWTSDYENGESAIQASLDRLGLDYIDLMILHHSQPQNDITAYNSMEKAVKEGKIRSVGLSNYYDEDDFDRVANAVEIKPALLQNETHPYHQSGKMKNHIAKYGTVLESWYPLGGRGHTQTLFNDETIASIASAHGKSSAQIILRWHLQAGQIAIPGSSNEQHIIENYDIFDFELSQEEMNDIAKLERNERFSNY